MAREISELDPGRDSSDKLAPVSFIQLFRYFTAFEILLDVIGVVAAGVSGAAQPLMALLFGNLVESFVLFSSAVVTYSRSSGSPAATEALHIAAAHLRSVAAKDASYLVYIGVGMLCCTYIYMVSWVYTAEINAKRIREKYLQAVLRQDIAYFDTVGAGEVATRIQTDTHLVQQGISEKVALIVSYLGSFTAGYIIAYIRCWRLALATTSVLPCIIILGTLMHFFTSKYILLSLNHISEGGSRVEEIISSIRTVHAFGSQKVFGDLYDGHIRAASLADYKAAIWNGVFIGFFGSVTFSVYALAFQFGTTLVNEGHVNAGQVVNVILAILIGSFSLIMIPPELRTITAGQAAAAKLFATIERAPDIDSSDPGGLKPDRVVGEITLEDIKFNYPSRPDVPIVKGISITFKAGETSALVGASGSGKSTIISLIERFYDPLDGIVKLDGANIRDLNLKWLRSQIGLVSQEPTLFATTIRGNVAHGLINTPHEHLSEEEKFKLIKEACIKANAASFITNLPDGYDTMVGERGFLLSGGQKQRVAIARAIVSDPKILLLDEATSALDTQSEGVVQDALDRAAAGRTTITIAHRLSTIKDADCIYVMGDGLVLERGTHAGLLADEDGAYSRLVQAQKLRQAKPAANSDISLVFEDEKVDAGIVPDELPSLGRKETNQSIASSLGQKRNDDKKQRQIDEDKYNMSYLFVRIGLLNPRGLWRYALGSICAMTSGMGYPVMGIIYAFALSGFSEPEPSLRRHDGNTNALWFFILALVVGTAYGFQTFFFTSSASILISKIRSLTFKAVLRQEIAYFDEDGHSAGSLTVTVSDNPQKIHGLAGATLAAIIQAMTTIIGGSVIGLVYAWKIALVGIACIPVIMSTGYIRLRVVVLKDQRNKSSHESSAQLACEAAASIRTVASLTREEDCLRIYSQSLEEPLKKSNRTAVWSCLLFAFSQSTMFYVIALVFWYGSIVVSRLEFSTLGFFIALMSTAFGVMQMGNIFAYVPDISSARGAAAATIKLLDTVPGIDVQSSAGKTFEGKQVRGQIEFEDVHFRYPTRPGVRVLRDLSFKIEPGTYVALVGASGCGKSTVIQLLQRFYDPLAGRILLDGRPIDEYNVQAYRKQIALVSQEPTLYAGTIRFNILLGSFKPESDVTQKEIEEACRDANILDFIESLPDGFETQVGGKGSQLSGGQKQRIAIARALLRNPKVLLLDEATSALDSNSETVVQAALDQATRGRTTIAIAHRLSTIQNAGRIYFIKEGRVSEAGTHDELLSLRGDYYEQVQLQALSKT